jgi:hypothetical protein
MNTANQTSALVGGFEHVTVASDLACPTCCKSFSPHDLRHDGNGEVQLRCPGCERDAISATIAAAIAFDEEGE